MSDCDSQPQTCYCSKSIEKDTYKCLECTIQVAGPDDEDENLVVAQSVIESEFRESVGALDDGLLTYCVHAQGPSQATSKS